MQSQGKIGRPIYEDVHRGRRSLDHHQPGYTRRLYWIDWNQPQPR